MSLHSRKLGETGCGSRMGSVSGKTLLRKLLGPAIDRISRDLDDRAGIHNRLSVTGIEVRTARDDLAGDIHIGVTGHLARSTSEPCGEVGVVFSTGSGCRGHSKAILAAVNVKRALQGAFRRFESIYGRAHSIRSLSGMRRFAANEVRVLAKALTA